MSEVTFYRLPARSWTFCLALALDPDGNHSVIAFDVMGDKRKAAFEKLFLKEIVFNQVKTSAANYAYVKPIVHDSKRIIPISAAGLFLPPQYKYGNETNGPRGIVTPKDKDEIYRFMRKAGNKLLGYEAPDFIEDGLENTDINRIPLAYIDRAHDVYFDRIQRILTPTL